jgi:Mrp family chromosome partitioning ATPase
MVGVDPSPFVELLDSETETIDLPALVRTDKGTGIHVIGAGRASDVPTDQLVAGDVFARLLETARSMYDVVILDTPPVGPVVDGLYLAADASVILFVVRAGTTSQAEARLALASLMNAKGDDTRMLSVLNQQERASASYKGRYEAYYYGGAA